MSRLNEATCQVGGHLDKQAARCGPRATLGSTSKNQLEGRKTETVRLINAKHQASIGKWNVRTLWKDGSLELLVDHLDKWFRWHVIRSVKDTQGMVEHNGHQRRDWTSWWCWYAHHQGSIILKNLKFTLNVRTKYHT